MTTPIVEPIEIFYYIGNEKIDQIVYTKIEEYNDFYGCNFI